MNRIIAVSMLVGLLLPGALYGRPNQTIGPNGTNVRSLAVNSGGQVLEGASARANVTHSILATSAVPTIMTFSPTSGPVGMSITITGTNFNAAPTNNIVYFGAVRATVTAATSTSLGVIVPTGATYMPITVTVDGLTAYSPAPFVVTFPGGGSITPGSFAPKVDFPLGANPYGIAISDIDGDGKPDFVIVNSDPSGSVSVFRNTSVPGLTTFESHVDFATGANPFGVATSDLDGDGKPDLVVVNFSSNTISVFRNTSTSGSITFAAKSDIAGADPYSIAIGDMDGDGKPDLVVANSGYPGSSVSVFRNTSSTGIITFASPLDLSVGSYSSGIAVSDIDGDGKPDIAVTNAGSNSVSVFRNTSSSGTINSSSFDAKVDISSGAEPDGIAIGDVDGDGKPDLIVTNQFDQTASVFRNMSSPGVITAGSFASAVDFAVGSGAYTVVLGDVDGDGKPDLVVGNAYSDAFTVLRNTTSPGPITAGSFASKADFITGVWPFVVATGDLDGDGRPDVIAANRSSNTVSVFRNNVGISDYSITSTAGPNGSITPPGLATVNQGGSASFAVSPNTNYHIEDVLVDGASVGAVSSYLFSNVTASHTIAATFGPDPGTISGSVHVGTSGLANVTVSLLNDQLSPISDMVTGPSGGYTFTNLIPGSYNVMIVEPLGYTPDGNPKETILNLGGTNHVDFTLTPVTITNGGRGMGYWKQQFDKHISNKGSAQETQAQLNQYIIRVHQYYTPHFNVFSGCTTFSQWQAVLSPANKASMLDKARQQLAALVMNFTSLKIGQSVVATADGRTAGDVLTYVSILVTGGDASKYELAKNLAEQVCSQQTIGAGVVSPGNVLYKGVGGEKVNWNFEIPAEFALEQNYPNPFNPSTVISFSISSRSYVSLRVFDAMGREVATLISEELPAGNHSRQWNATGMASGVYFYRLNAGDFVQTKKFVLLR
ncbi:MAG: FG-GAP-like repeat-containing protein [Ignavibacteria bacterium]|nr:FG-GAP-like repeat-containing protein [Ignavibacteria bacterium]